MIAKASGTPHTLGLLCAGGERPHCRAAKKRDELATSHCLLRGSGHRIVPAQTCIGKGPANVRVGSEADICVAKSDARFTPNIDRESGLPRQSMFALLLKADMCSAK